MVMLNKFRYFVDEEEDMPIDSVWIVTVMLCWSQCDLEPNVSVHLCTITLKKLAKF